jgi:para-aminobenzoate synthetase/4-amino-4-deoxychorismate lyase
LKLAPVRALLRAPEEGWWRFESPVESLSAATVAELPGLLERVDRATADGLWAVGYVTYEAAPAFDSALVVRRAPPGPLAAFSLFHAPQTAELARGDEPPQVPLAPLQAALGEPEHAAAVAAILAAIAAGETYQVNFTFPLRTGWRGDSQALFRRLATASAAPYATYLDCGERAVLSLSPELFFRRQGDRIEMRPMKGTRLRGRFPEEDVAQAAGLAASPKERAENLMIVDMARNDLGRIAAPGSVRVDRLFELERYPTVWQMTSTVSAQSSAGLAQLFAALFPCASVTGAPKARTMQWIARLERAPRGIYCGAIGWAAPARRASFAVAIRTAVVDRSAATLEYGVGSGVVWDSQAAAEYQECLAKARAFAEPAPPFALFETMLWRPRCGVALLEKHLARLAASASYFGFEQDERAWRSAALAGLAALAGKEMHRQRIRLELSPDGAFSFASRPFRPERREWRVILARDPVASQDVSLFHKTTNRAVYDAALAAARAAGADEAILWNERGELTEGTRTNLVLELGGERLTPARTCGLLGGVFRQELLERGKIREALLTREDLLRAERVLLVNALRGWIPAGLA